MPERFGGAGVRDFRYNAVLSEEIVHTGTVGVGFTLQNDVVAPYLLDLCTEEQKERWLPGFGRGQIISAIAMTEPGAGSDLQAVRTTARRDGDVYVLNGSKTFITNGILADLMIVVAKTDPEAGHKGISLLVVERGMPGFERGRNLDKAGLRRRTPPRPSSPTSECPPRTCSARRAGVRPPDAKPAPGTAVDRGRRGRRL